MAYETKTKQTTVDPMDFIEAVANEQRRKDSLAIMKMMKRVTGEKPKMWGPTMVGFGDYHYKYESGHEGDCFMTGFSPRKQALTIYMMAGFEKYIPEMKKLGKFKTGKCCLYINKLEDVDMKILEKLVANTYKEVKKHADKKAKAE